MDDDNSEEGAVRDDVERVVADEGGSEEVRMDEEGSAGDEVGEEECTV